MLNIVFSFIGILPKYILDCVYQTRLFYDGDVYLIVNDLNSIYLEEIKKYNIHIIDYDLVKSEKFIIHFVKYIHKFLILNKLKGREELFIRSLERFYLVQNLMILNNISNVLFIEIDNLIYDDPYKWLDIFNKKELCYMYDNKDRFSSGIMFIKNSKSLDIFLDTIYDHIQNDNCFISEMRALSKLYNKDKDNIQILPTYWNDLNITNIAHENFHLYNSIFDSAPIGIFLGGVDPYHTNGILTKGTKWKFSEIDYTKKEFKWVYDIKGRKQPFIWNDTKWILINNLHIHSKEMHELLSK